MTDDEFEKRMVSAIERALQKAGSDNGSDKPVSLQEAFDQGFEAMKGYIDRSFDEIQKELSHLAERIAAVEEKAGDPAP
ncbi:hypothetical protein [Brucella lupini]|uniref:Uncharacterized protein n=1 Tax=Brucella lupini TaxID=255457 RepID=A0A256GC60_9HYPH|nr:hypothetical protein [Brucella lupini]KAB2706482.1 hypothetical protein F9L03_02090 [Brucella lupini]OYR24683.1 hypothetical protein CES86_4972 [Brucella lupini]